MIKKVIAAGMVAGTLAVIGLGFGYNKMYPFGGLWKYGTSSQSTTSGYAYSSFRAGSPNQGNVPHEYMAAVTNGNGVLVDGQLGAYGSLSYASVANVAGPNTFDAGMSNTEGNGNVWTWYQNYNNDGVVTSFTQTY